MSVTEATSAGALRRRLAARLADGFARQGRDGTAALDARLLLAHALGIDAAQLVLHDDQPVDAATEAAADTLVERRIAGLPVARIVGRTAFFGREFDIGPDTLVPRPDSETVVEAAIAFVERSGGRDRQLAVADLGTGSGVLLLALLSELPHAYGIGVDVVTGALDVARSNAQRLDLDRRARFVIGDWGTALAGGFDIVVANPPYVKSGAIAGLQVEIATHDPHIALDGGVDGLASYRAILADLDRLLARCGRGFLEIGFGQAKDVAKLGANLGFSTTFHCDLADVERVGEFCRSGQDHHAGAAD